MAAVRLLLVAALAALPLWLASMVPAFACGCPYDGSYGDPVTATVRRSEVVAIGTVGEMLVLPPESVAFPERVTGDRIPIEVKFDVSEYIKGSGAGTELIFLATKVSTRDENGNVNSIAGGTSCDMRLSVGEGYLMFLSRNDALRYTTHVCMGNVRTSDDFDESEYIAQIRAAAAAEQVGLPPTGSGSPHQRAPIGLLAAASALASIGLAANAAFALRRRN